MSDTPQGQNWWRATDGKWYPPEQLPPGYSLPMSPAPQRRSGGLLSYLGCFGSLLLVVAVVAYIAYFAPRIADMGNDGVEAEQPTTETAVSAETTFSATVSSIVTVNPATAIATVDITNVGNSAGVPYCTVRVADPSGTYKGVDLFEFEELQPGERRQFDAQLTVTNQGAVFATIGSADC